jgi:hypothetical protein
MAAGAIKSKRIHSRGLSPSPSTRCATNPRESLPSGWEKQKKKRMINPSVVWERGGVREAHHQLLPRLCRFVAWGRRPSALAPNVVTWWPPSSLLDAGSAGASCAESKSPFQFCWNTVFFIYEHEHPSVHMVGVLYLGVGGYTTSRCRSLASTLSQVDLHRDAGLGQIHTWALKGVRQRVK